MWANLIDFARYGPIGVILVALGVSAGLFARYKTRPSDRQLLMYLIFFVIAILAAVVGDLLDRLTGPWVFVGAIQNNSRQILADNSNLYVFRQKDADDVPIMYVFYISREKIRDGDPLPLPLLEPQQQLGQDQHHSAWVCFTRQPNPYTEKVLLSGDVQFEPHGAGHRLCGPPEPITGAPKPIRVPWNIVSPGNAATITSTKHDNVQFAAQEPSFVYTTSSVVGLCKWQSTNPPVVGTTLVICNPEVLATSNPGEQELSLYVAALQNELTDAGTKASVLKKVMGLTEDQQTTLFNIPTQHAAYCDNEQAYPDPAYSEPLALTLFDLARSTDRQISVLATRAIDKLRAESKFAEFIAQGRSECRNIWMLRLDMLRAKSVLILLSATGVPSAELDALDVRTPDVQRTIIRPTSTADGDLYRVEVKVPAVDSALRCLAKVYRLVNIQDDSARTTAPADPVDKEFQILKKEFANKSRTSGWYNKIFQRDLLVGARRCEVTAVAVPDSANQ